MKQIFWFCILSIATLQIFGQQTEVIYKTYCGGCHGVTLEGNSAPAFIISPLFAKWKNNLMIGALAFEELRRLVIVNDKVTKQEIIMKGYGRVRDIKTAPMAQCMFCLTNPI